MNRFVRGQVPPDAEAVDALAGFARWPQWMWRNTTVLEFVGWLRDWNDSQPETAKTGVYGLDLYSMYTSMGEVIRFLDRVDREAARVSFRVMTVRNAQENDGDMHTK